MSLFMRPKIALIAAGLIVLVLLGLRWQSLPFIPHADFSDSAVSHWPAARHLRQSVLEAGSFPLWQETILGGGPFAANPLNKTAYPLQWLVLVLPPAPHINVMILLHLLLAGLGMWHWARQQGLSDVAAVFSGAAYAFAPKVLAHTGAGHVDLLYALAWWPLLMAAVFELIRSSLARRVIVKTAVFAALLLLGDVRLGLFALLLAAAYAIIETAKAKHWRILHRSLPALALFLLLTLSVVAPLLAWRPYLSRAELSPQDAGVFALETGQLLGLVLPPHSGNQETMTYLGLPVLLFAGIAVFSAPRKHAFWWLALIIAALYAFGPNAPLWSLLVGMFPFLLWFRVPSRAWFVVVLVACLLAGYGLQAVMNTIGRLRDDMEIPRLALKRLAIAGAMGASLFCGSFTLVMLGDLPATIGLGVITVGLATGIVLLLAFYSKLSPVLMAWLVVGVVFIDLVWTGAQWLEWRGPEQWLTHQQTLVDALVEDDPARIYSPNYALEQQVAAANGLHLFYGVDPFQLSGVVDAIEQGSGVPVDEYSVVLPPLALDSDEADSTQAMLSANRDARPDAAVLAQWAVSYVVATYPIDHERLTLHEQVGEFYIYRNLDYAGESPQRWPGWGSLPDEATIAQINSLTLVATLISMIGLAICLILWRVTAHE